MSIKYKICKLKNKYIIMSIILYSTIIFIYIMVGIILFERSAGGVL